MRNYKFALGGNVNTYDTVLTPQESKKYSVFAEAYAKAKGFNIKNLTRDYDLQGYWKKNQNNLPKNMGRDLHLNDEFKKPSHITFSNQSIYSTPEHTGGAWVENNGKWSFTPSKYNLTITPKEQLQEYFNNYEKDSNLIIPKFALGGQVNKPNINVEGGEVIQTPNGSSYAINGPSHAQGGIDMSVPNNSIIFSDRISINGKTLADRKKERDKLLQKLKDKSKGNFLAKNTLERTAAKSEHEEMADVMLQKYIRDRFVGEQQQLPKAALGAGDYMTMATNIIGPISNLASTKKSIATTSKQMPNFNKEYGIAGLNKLRDSVNEINASKENALSKLNSELAQSKQDQASQIDAAGGTLNLRRALRAGVNRSTDVAYATGYTNLEGSTIDAKTQLNSKIADSLDTIDEKRAIGESAAFVYNQQLARQNAADKSNAENAIFTGLQGVAGGFNNTQKNNQFNTYMKVLASTGGFTFDSKGNIIPIGKNNTNVDPRAVEASGANLPSSITGNPSGIFQNQDVLAGIPKMTFAYGGVVKGPSTIEFKPNITTPSSRGKSSNSNMFGDIGDMLKPVTFETQKKSVSPDATRVENNIYNTKFGRVEELINTARSMGSNVNDGYDASPVYVGKGNINKILSTIKKSESGNYKETTKLGGTASGAYQITNSTWKNLTKQFGIGTQYTRAADAPPHIQDTVAAKYVEQILAKNKGNLAAIPNTWYTGNASGKMSKQALMANRGLTSKKYTSKWLNTYNNNKG